MNELNCIRDILLSLRQTPADRPDCDVSVLQSNGEPVNPQSTQAIPELKKLPPINNVCADTVGDLLGGAQDSEADIPIFNPGGSDTPIIPPGKVANDPLGNPVNRLHPQQSEEPATADPPKGSDSTIPETNVASDQNTSDQLAALNDLNELLKSNEPVSFDPYGRLCREKDAKSTNATIPNTKVASDNAGNLLNRLRHQQSKDPSPTAPDPVSPTPAEPPKGSDSIIPGTKVADDTADDPVCELHGDSPPAKREEVAAYTPGASDPPMIPPGKVAAQWYETNPALKPPEIMAMRKTLHNPSLEPKYKPDGRMYWEVAVPISAVPGIQTKLFRLELVYDADHPACRYGTSIKIYPKSPSMDEMDRDFNKVLAYWAAKCTDPDEKRKLRPQPTPHTLPDANKKRYLCSARISDTSASLESGMTTAATSLRYGYRWLTVYQASLYHRPTLMDFLDHDKI